jgi:CubicO group peptidase (beta-lactamase class C family)
MSGARRLLAAAASLSALLAASFCRCVPDGLVKHPSTTTPERLDDGWEIAAPGDVDLDPDSLDKVMADVSAEDRYLNVLALLVARRGRLVFETYLLTPEDRDQYHHVMSVTKSVTSLGTGLAFAHGLSSDLDTPLYSYLPDEFDADPRKREITIRHLLTMRSGLLFDNSDFSTEIFANRPEHEIAYILAKPLYADPGDSFYYRDCDPQLLSCAIERATGRTLAELVRDGIFNPLGITDYYWEHTREGHTSGAVALHLRPRDMAKLGQLVLQRGAWQGQQLVPAAWVDSATTTQTALPESEGPERGWSYGYYWWILSRFNGFTAWGSGGQYILVVPDKELVIVMVSMPDVSGDAGVPTTLGGFEDLVAPVVRGCR